ncbi:MAG: short-chain dehydrogenase [Chromatiales bacterium]|jgi:NAD(P)-dependent dehydrogenase (short-subunit alcohol dehydrogenase family)|nr:short-chain dehydrogenase [Chromatiales bacterium]MDP6149871.1 SDR family NAD(P)-dependent oxidoreductase [Gammaproteobacteria bacterium]MDP7093884.1 SDR family NAD(P)-dependent oxidoreductase [Gammaproteobacteria bacterium]MDP7270584.1 SDR family NAD(P)-dependent oxidoreductase [Gammaproteobacteria bacterium]HJP04313.1 SDR family NAD(P)-dependent oxidoreductase [Gammaproteobacteria bacterium]
MEEQIYLVTGATDGIGKALSLALAKTGATVIMHGRSPEKADRALNEIGDATGNTHLHTVLADYASFDQVAALAEQVQTEFGGLNVLINNAGMLTDHRQLSHDGLELTFAVNYLAPFLLTNLLLDTLKANAPARIVNVSSTAMGGGLINFSDMQAEQHFDGWQAYANSKLANVLSSHWLASQLEGTGVVSNSLCPGLIDTNFLYTNNLFSSHERELMRGRMRSPEEGALVPLYLATAPEAAATSGKFFVREGRDGRRTLPLQWDEQLAGELVTRSFGYLKGWCQAPTGLIRRYPRTGA